MSSASLRWIALSALGLSAGVGTAVVLEGPIGALVGMVLVTPALTLLAGVVLGAVQWIELRRHVELAGRWLLSTALGLGIAILSACGLGLGFPAGSLVADTVLSGLASPAGLITLVLVAGAALGTFTARPLTRAAAA